MKKIIFVLFLLIAVNGYAQQTVRTVTGSTTAVTGTVTVSVSGTATVTGTVTANLGTLNGAATAAAQTTGNSSLASILTAQTDGSQKTQMYYGGASSTTPVLPTDVVHVIADSGTITTITSPVTVTSAQTGSGTATGAIRVELPTNGTGVLATVGTVTTLTGTTTLTPGTGAANLGKAEDAIAASGDTGVAALAVAQATPTATAADGDYIAIKTNANGVLWTQPISTGATAATKPATATQNGAAGVSAEQTAVTNGQLTNLVADLVGKLIVLPYANPENFVNGTTAAITDTTSTSVIASAGGSLRNYITQCTVTNSHATVGTFVKILEGSNIINEGYAAPLGGGYTATFPTPLRGAAATAINAQAVTTGANFIVSCSGYKGL